MTHPYLGDDNRPYLDILLAESANQRRRERELHERRLMDQPTFVNLTIRLEQGLNEPLIVGYRYYIPQYRELNENQVADIAKELAIKLQKELNDEPS